MRVRCKQRITTTGLDIYFHKVKPAKHIDVTDIDAVHEYHNKLIKDKFTKRTDTLLDKLNEACDITTRTNVIKSIRNCVKKFMVYDWYYDQFTPEKTNQEIVDKIHDLQSFIYPHEDVYFRKANFVYAFFKPYLVDESCMVTKDMVKELLSKCDKIIAAAKEDGIIDEKDNIINLDDYYYHYKQGENWINMSEERKAEEEARIEKLTKKITNGKWVKVAEEELPTQSGFFFGSTDYSIYYLRDILDCKSQFEKLLKHWKDDEVVYNIMSW